jgi:hypothetical protein
MASAAPEDLLPRRRRGFTSILLIARDTGIATLSFSKRVVSQKTDEKTRASRSCFHPACFRDGGILCPGLELTKILAVAKIGILPLMLILGHSW